MAKKLKLIPASIFRVTYYDDGGVSTYEMVGEPGPISKDLIEKVHNYNSIVGITAVKKTTDGIITWEFGNNWYSTEEVDRMTKLKIFT